MRITVEESAALQGIKLNPGRAEPPPLRSVLRILAAPYLLNRADPHRPAAVYVRFYGRMYAEPNDVHRRVV